MADVHQLPSTASSVPATPPPRRKRGRSSKARRDRIVSSAVTSLSDMAAVLQYLTRANATEEETSAAHQLAIRQDELLGVLMSVEDGEDLDKVEVRLAGRAMTQLRRNGAGR